MDFVAEDAGLVDAELRLGAVSEFGAGGEERVVADGLKNGELRAGNFSGEKLGAGFDGNDGIYGASDDLAGIEILARDSGENAGPIAGAMTKMARMRGSRWDLEFSSSAAWIAGSDLARAGGFGEKAGILERVMAHAIGFGRLAKVLETRKLGDAAGDFDDCETAERKPGCADALGVDARAESRVGEHLIEEGT